MTKPATTRRINDCFGKARAEGRLALGVFITAGDPSAEISQELLLGLPEAGADFVELGMPFSDPMADGPAIQAASLRAIEGGATLETTLGLAATFRQAHPEVPLILMGYYNPIYSYGVDKFLAASVKVGVDGLLVVDLPPEEDGELCVPARDKGLAFIRMLTPTSDAARFKVLLPDASGFLYYVAITGITGTRTADEASIAAASQRIRASCKTHGLGDIPLVVGFGIREPQQIKALAKHAQGVVVGSAVVDRIAGLADKSKSANIGVADVLSFIKDLKGATHSAKLAR